jgi:hypothetical protein
MRIWLLSLLLVFPLSQTSAALPPASSIDASARTGADGFAPTFIDRGKARYVQPYGVRKETGFAELVSFVPLDASVPFESEYGDWAGKS